MTPTILAGALFLTQVALLAAILFLRYLGNKDLFKTDRQLAPVPSKNKLFGGFSALYDRLDRIPVLRRSGTANEFDLLKAMLLVTVPVFLLELLSTRPSLFVTFMAGNFLLLIVNAIVFAHPAIKRGVSGKQS